MKCPYEDILCDCIDTSDMNKPSCEECRHYPDPVKKLMLAYPLEQMIEFLPKTLIKEKKSIFLADEIFDINISRDGMDNWVIDYINQRMMRSLFMTSDKSLHRSIALMLADLIGNNYIQALKTPGKPLYKENTGEEHFHIGKGL